MLSKVKRKLPEGTKVYLVSEVWVFLITIFKTEQDFTNLIKNNLLQIILFLQRFVIVQHLTFVPLY